MYIRYIVLAVCCFVVAQAAQAQWTLYAEVGAAWNGYNDVAVPGDTGTRFSLTSDLDPTVAFAPRVRVTYAVAARHHLSLMAAPLRTTSRGIFRETVEFSGGTFAPDIPVEARYRFDSYRFTYRYKLIQRDHLEIDLGVTAKIRDAAIRLQQQELAEDGEIIRLGVSAEKTNTGFVPLIHFRVRRTFSDLLALLVQGDALAAPQGRAEDVLVALEVAPQSTIGIQGGLRVLEGGAGNDEVYNFTLFIYGVVGAVVRF